MCKDHILELVVEWEGQVQRKRGDSFQTKGDLTGQAGRTRPTEASELEKGRQPSGGYLELNRDTSVRDNRKLAATQKSLPTVTATSD